MPRARRLGRLAAPLLAVLLALVGFQAFLRLPEAVSIPRSEVQLIALPVRLHAYRTRGESGLAAARSPESFLGKRFLGNPQAGLLYPPNLLFSFVDPERLYGLVLPFHAAVGALGAFLLARALGRSRLASLLAGTGYALSAAFVARAYFGHVPLVVQAGLAPWVFLLLLRAPRSARAAVGLGVVGALSALAGHWQETAYLALGALFCGAYLVLAPGKDVPGRSAPRRTLSHLGLALLVALALALPELLANLEFVRDGTRARLSYAQIAQFAAFPDQLLDVVFPFAHGTPAMEHFFGNTIYGENVGWAGAVLAGLALVGVARGGREARFLAALALLTFVHALGPPGGIHRALSLLPPFDMVRSPGRTLFLGILAVSLLAARGLDALRPRVRRAGGSRALPLGLALGAVLLAAGLGLGPVSESLPAGPGGLARAGAAAANAGKSLAPLALLLLVGACWLGRARLDVRATRGALVLAAAGEGLVFAFALLYPVKAPGDALARALAARGPGRVWDLARALDEYDVSLHGLESVGGLEPLPPAAHAPLARELLEDSRPINPTDLFSLFTTTDPGACLRIERAALDLLRVRFLLLPRGEQAPADFAAIGESGAVVIFENRHALADAWLFGAEAARAAVRAGPSELARLARSAGSPARAAWGSPDRVTLEAPAEGDGAGARLYVVPTTFLRGFEARTPGAVVVPVGGLLGVAVAGGVRSPVEVVFAPRLATLSPRVTLGAALGVLVLLLRVPGRRRGAAP